MGPTQPSDLDVEKLVKDRNNLERENATLREENKKLREIISKGADSFEKILNMPGVQYFLGDVKPNESAEAPEGILISSGFGPPDKKSMERLKKDNE